MDIQENGSMSIASSTIFKLKSALLSGYQRHFFGTSEIRHPKNLPFGLVCGEPILFGSMFTFCKPPFLHPFKIVSTRTAW
jgi:hypothetical protein